MKTIMLACLLFVCFVPSLRADLDIRSVTPANAEKLGWMIKVTETDGYDSFIVQLPPAMMKQKRYAHLSVWDDRKLICSSLLGVHEFQDAKRYEFSVARQFLKDSRFGLSPDNTVFELSPGTSYRLRLLDFVKVKTLRIPAK